MAEHLGGAGIEAELAPRVSAEWVVGGHVALEKITNIGQDGYMASVDARFHYNEVMWLQVGGARESLAGSTSYTVLAGVGLEGRLGAKVAGTELGIAVTLGALVLYGLSQARW